MNKEKLKGYLEKVKTTLGKISKKIWIIIGVCLAIILAIIIIMIVVRRTRPYAVLVDQVNDEEFASVLTWLQDQGVTDYKTEGSRTIMVPAGQADTLKARLLQQQYSSANVSPSGYFERVGALSTMYDREMATKLDLEDQLEAVIRQFNGVLSADVKINMGEDNGYVLYQNNVVDASASVTLTMQEGKLLSTEQAKAIRNYVAHAVPNLDVDNVYLTDTLGNTYSDFSSVTGQSDTLLKLQAEEDMQNRMRTQIMRALSKVVGGEENVAVSVIVTMELGDKTINTHDVKLPESALGDNFDGRGIIGSEYWLFQFITPDDGAVGGVVGTTTNADLPTYMEPGEAQAELQRILEEEANRIYDNSYEDVQMIVHCATLVDASVAVWINGGAYKNPEDIPSEETIRNWVAAAANIQPVFTDEMTREEYLNWKIAVATDPFVDTSVEEPVDTDTALPGTIWGIPYWAIIAAGVGLLVFVLVLVLILVLRGKKRKKEEAERQALIETMEAAALPGQIVQIDENGQPFYVDVDMVDQIPLDEDGNPVTGANVMDLHTERSMELRQSIRDFVDENMEVAALLLKSWMKEGGEKNG